MRLREWQDANGKKISTTSSAQASAKPSGDYKKKLEKLIDYHIAHKGPDVKASSIKKDINPYDFHYTEYHRGGIGGYQTDIVGSFDKKGDWGFSVFMDGKQTAGKRGSGWDRFVYDISFYLALPPVTTDPEYQDLLEWVDAKGNKINTNTSTSSQPASNGTKNYPSQEYRYKRLLAQIDSDGFCKYTINLLDDRILAITLNNGVGVKIIFKPYVPCYLVQVDGSDSAWKDYEDVLKLLIIEGIIGNTDLCESAGSIAEDFKLYENLWD